MKRWSCVIFALAICISGMIACTEQMPDNPEGDFSYTSRLVGLSSQRVVCWNHYIVTDLSKAIYDRTSGEIRYGLCEDPECDGTCLLDQADVTYVAATQGRLYFTARGKRETHYGYRTLLTGEVKVLLTVDAEQRTPNQPTFLEDGWLYYEIKLLRDGGDPDNADDYLAHLCRIPEDGGKQEILYEMRQNAEILLLVADGSMYTYLNSIIWKFDLDTMERRELFTFEGTELGGIGEFSYLDGKLYFNTVVGNDTYLCTMNPETGEWAYLLDVPVITYVITNDAIYFSPAETRQINDPVKYPTVEDGAKMYLFSPTLFACDLDGKNVRDIWTDESGLIDFCEQYIVVDDVFYGWLFEFDLEKNTTKERYFAEIHFDTGEIVPATVVK